MSGCKGILDGICPEGTILTSNSSSFIPSQYAKDLYFPGRIIGTHYFNPPYLVPLVEVIKGKETSEETLEAKVKLLREIGKKVAVVKKEMPGFIADKIQLPSSGRPSMLLNKGLPHQKRWTLP